MKCTLVSLCPFPIRESKPGLNPGIFVLPSADTLKHEPQVAVITDSEMGVYQLEGRVFKATEPSDKLAAAICWDHNRSQLEYDEGDVSEDRLPSEPAFFWVEGELTAKEVKDKFPEKIQLALKKQAEWFRRLVAVADDEWQKSHQRKFITDRMRLAAKCLGLKREWISVVPVGTEALNVANCPSCDTPVNANAAVCKHCGAIVNKAKHAQLVKDGVIRANA